jgi:hypothetical protein
MAEGNTGEVKIKVSTEGVEPAASGLGKLSAIFDGLQGKLKDFSKTLKESGGETGLFSVGIDTLNQAVTIFRNPLAAAGAALVHFKNELHASAEAALQNYERMRELTATFGENVTKVSDVTAAYELAGVSSERLQIAASILGSRAENAGKSFLKFGINVNDAAGNVKTPLALFDEVRAKLSSISNVSERAGAAAELFGARQARALAPALNLSAAAFDGYLKKVEKYGEFSEVVHHEAGKTKEAVDEVSLAQQHYNEQWAATLGLPLEAFFAKRKSDWINLKSATVGATVGFIGALFGVPLAQVEEDAARVQENLMKLADQVRKFKQETAASPGHISREKAQEMIEAANIEYEGQARRLKGEASFEAQRLRMEEDTASKGLLLEKEATEELIRQENIRFEKTLEAKRRTGYGGASGLTPDEEQKLRAQHNDRIYQMELENKEKELAVRRALAQERVKTLEQGFKTEELFHKEYLGRIRAEFDYEKAAISLFAETRAVEVVATAKLSIENADRETRETIRFINQRIGVKQQELAASKGIAAEEQRISLEIKALEAERTNAEIDNTKKIAAARAELLAKTKEMAAAEASLGESLEQKAISRLQAQGKTEVTAADIAEEKYKMGQEARETRATFGGGGAVDISALQFSREYGKQLEQMRNLGTTSAQAGSMFEAQQSAAYAGRAFNGIPTGLQSMAPELQAIASQMKDSADSAVERLGATLKDAFEYFVQKFNRKLEFESARQ